MNLFSPDKTAGIFRGFSEGGLEFHAELVLPYRSEFQSQPMHGQFLIVQLEGDDEAVLGRITTISSQGRLASSAGEDYGLRAVSENRQVPEDLREQYLKYQVRMRVLGVLRSVNHKVVFVPSHRRLPHVGSKVAFLSDELLKEVAGHNASGALIGYFALGEFVYAGDDNNLQVLPWMQVKKPMITPHFDVKNLVSRRSFVFARAGFGKSNLVKLLFSELYRETPTVVKRNDKRVPVGSIIFDPDGEYFWPDDKHRPGLCDVPHLQERIVVFTRRKSPSPFYSAFVAGDIKLDIRRLRPSDVISIALSPEKQDQQNVRKLKGLNDTDWAKLVDEVYRNRNSADEKLIQQILGLKEGQDAELLAARANMTTIVQMLHDPSSQMMDMLIEALRLGKICIIDVSQLRGTPALVLSGLVLKRIFDHNQEEFTRANPQTIPTIAVVEEAQSVLGNASGSGGEGPYVAWVKEGRKFDLGAVLITQQPNSISSEILSQGDNWFVFHLLSAGDLMGLKRANAHFSDDLLSTILNEPIPGNGVFWSSATEQSYPIPVRVMSFEALHKPRDPQYDLKAERTAATVLKEKYESALADMRKDQPIVKDVVADSPEMSEPDEPEDVLETFLRSAIERLKRDAALMNRLRTAGVPWKEVLVHLEKLLPDTLVDREQVAFQNVRRAMNNIFGEDNWDTERKESRSGKGYTTWIAIKKSQNR